MPTGDRFDFVQQSVLNFRAQTYPARELIIVDSGAKPVRDLCAGAPDITYIRVPASTSTGAKLNLGIERARGSVIQKWDDDDYHHPEFLQTAVSHLPDQPDAMVIWDCFLVLLCGERALRHSGCGWRVGGTMCFHRALWEQQPFRNVARSEDSLFIEDHSPVVIPVCAPEMYIVVRHGRNTWKRMEDGSAADDYFWQLPSCSTRLESVIRAEQLPFYRALTALQY